MKHMTVGAAAHHSSRLAATERCVALPLDTVPRSSNWTLGPISDREPGNACVGIAIGCLLSLPIWLAILACYALLS
jgi:hypothetical protein